MKLGIKYCGGCNPRYNRGLQVCRLQQDFPALEVGTGEAALAGADLLLVLCGCSSRCAGHAQLSARLGRFVMCDEQDYPALAAWVAKHMEDMNGK